MIKKSVLCFCLCVVCILSLVGCAVNVNVEAPKEGVKVEEVNVSFSGILKKITVYGSHKELIIEIRGEEKVFKLNNSTHIFDNSHRPKPEPYLEEGIYVKIEVRESEVNNSKPTIRYISVESYDGIFAI